MVGVGCNPDADADAGAGADADADADERELKVGGRKRERELSGSRRRNEEWCCWGRTGGTTQGLGQEPLCTVRGAAAQVVRLSGRMLLRGRGFRRYEERT